MPCHPACWRPSDGWRAAGTIPSSGALHPWPWTVDAEGQGAFYDSKELAIAAVRALQARGVRSIDVGCMQVNLMHHPNAFNSLEQAFDPVARNANYAAQFLTELHGQNRDLAKGGGDVPLGDAQTGSRVSAEGDGGVAGGRANGRR